MTKKVIAAFLLAIPLTTFVVSADERKGNDDNQVFASYGEGKVKLCYNGNTITVKPKDVNFYLTNGATRGECRPAPKPFTLASPVVTCKDQIPNVSLNWSTSVNADKYIIQRIVGDTFPAIYNRAIDDTEKTSYEDTKFEKDYGRINHSYRIIAKRDGMTLASNPVTVLLPECATKGKKKN